MADIYCSTCSESWDMDSLHDRVKKLHPDLPWITEEEPPKEKFGGNNYSTHPFFWEEFPYGIYRHPEDKGRTGWYDPVVYQSYYQPLVKEFRLRGCQVFGVHHNEYTKPKTPGLANAIYDIMGDDLDGVANAFEDAEDWGLW